MLSMQSKSVPLRGRSTEKGNLNQSHPSPASWEEGGGGRREEERRREEGGMRRKMVQRYS